MLGRPKWHKEQNVKYSTLIFKNNIEKRKLHKPTLGVHATIWVHPAFDPLSTNPGSEVVRARSELISVSGTRELGENLGQFSN